MGALPDYDAGWMDEELRILQAETAKFMDRELMPHLEEWRKAGMVSRDFWQKAADNGLLGAGIPENYGGMGGNAFHDAVVFREQGRRGDVGWGFAVHNIATHYILAYGTEEQKKRFLPRMASGELIGGIAMTEPGTGSDLQAIRTNAIKNGDNYTVNGQKTFTSNGQVGNLFIVVVKTNPSESAKGVSLLIVETDGHDGFRRGRNLEKLGMKSQDTSELFFDDMIVPVENLLGGVEGEGFPQLMRQLPWERLILGILAVGIVEYALDETLKYVKERKAFGQKVLDFQNTRFKLAEAKTKLKVTEAFIDKCLEKHVAGKLSAEDASMAKWWASQMQCDVVDECLQLFGGYGYMMEYPIAHLYADSRVQKIYGGTNEIMKELIGRSL